MEVKHPVITFQHIFLIMFMIDFFFADVECYRAKYQPYNALRQQFWCQYLEQYDTDDTGTISHIELRSKLNSLGCTIDNGSHPYDETDSLRSRRLQAMYHHSSICSVRQPADPCQK